MNFEKYVFSIKYFLIITLITQSQTVFKSQNDKT